MARVIPLKNQVALVTLATNTDSKDNFQHFGDITILDFSTLMADCSEENVFFNVLVAEAMSVQLIFPSNMAVQTL